ncbi:myb-like domain, Myb/SANT-like DNA-binding domain protein [Artemisia annua]|uniref:Myb-like domain, Myb/SANT-like DNA-binding domain protein n=1 Tax=Artemisia annua TaxID=35608 RepID=A0A2U1PJW8_ARTAN|nr:myb-like domain, Myb/SANT-like DNA-binding domain protein [Artemisia annua]
MEHKEMRDPRKNNRVARGAIRPRVQTQPDYRPQPSFQSQPGYRPQFEPQSPPFLYPQQLPQLPTQFNPFEPRYTQQKRRERESAPLPIREETDDDEYFDHVDMVTRPQRKVNKIWTPEEEEALAKAWIKISVDREVGDRQTKQGFWKRVVKHFKSLMPSTERTIHQLNSKWTPMHASIAAFNGYFIQTKRLKESGCDDLQVYERAQLDFEKQFRKAFAHTKAWHILKDQQKWKEQPLVSQAAESTGSSKKRKSSESMTWLPRALLETTVVFSEEIQNLKSDPTQFTGTFIAY